jgi:coenzyme F420-reducing hydrogenase alpha subunit
MNAASDLGALGPGALSIMAEIADERVCSVRVVSSRPTHLTRLFVGRPAEEIPILAERIYSLCGLSHAIVATRAIGAARGAASRAQSNQAQSIALLSERISELLRSSVTLALHENDAMRLDAGAMRPLAEVFSLTRDLLALAKSSRLTTASDRDALKSIIEKIGARARILGLPGDPDMLGARPAAGSWFGQLWSEIVRDEGFAACVPDALDVDDDPAVLARLRSDGDAFAAVPSLPGRAPETGAFARHWRKTDFYAGAATARLGARMIDLAECLDRLARAAAGDEMGQTEAHGVAPAVREGFAAVETSRGRLAHWTRLSRDGKIEDYAIVAPTEWNFHPAGPFVAAVLGARVSKATAAASIARLAGMFDPCVLYRVEVVEPAHA